MRVVFINPGFSDVANPTGGFWLAVSSFMRAAADDLDINLEILYCDRNHIKMKNMAGKVISRKNPPDYLVVVNEKSSAGPIVMDADRAGVNVFVMLNRFEGDQHRKMGQPRVQYKHWIGSLIPDNRFAGYQAAKLVIDRALKAGIRASDGRLHMIGFSGDYITQASIERVEGLKQAVSEYPDVDLKQVIPCNWSKDAAMEKTPKILKRYPETGAIWCANDPIAVGAVEGAVAAGKTPGKDIFLGGLNWDPPGLAKIKAGEIVTSVGGHFMTGGWALVLLYDYHHGRDFADEGTRLQYKIFDALDIGNIDRFMEKFGDRDWRKIDFTRFSKTLNPDISKYQFSVESIF
ncbi:MAG: ABC transporter substrate-binding protein [Desulfosalsimonadaceae bacterium]|nr:ABC transporter substrate-binding protein [Desulfosalsimonadaceae bacterium]